MVIIDLQFIFKKTKAQNAQIIFLQAKLRNLVGSVKNVFLTILLFIIFSALIGKTMKVLEMLQSHEVIARVLTRAANGGECNPEEI